MRNRNEVVRGLLCALVTSAAAWANTPPVVSNVVASQRPDASKLVDITYDLADADGDACTVWVVVSDNGGVSFRVPARTFVGAQGTGVVPGAGKQIVWDAGADIAGAVLANARVRVYADDGHGLAPMVLVNGGWFQMGDPWAEGGEEERPVHEVWVSTYRIDKNDVTNAHYAQFLNAGGADEHWAVEQRIVRQGEPGNYYYAPQDGFATHPVVFVSWDDAAAFCNWRSTFEGLPAGTYRVPTEAEWEKAAGWDPVELRHYRYGEHSDGCGYDCLSGARANYFASGDPFDNGTTPVGYFDGTTYGSFVTQDAKSYYGGYDFTGNVWQWCQDWYSPTYYAEGTNTDPTGPATGEARVLRGGHWNSGVANCRTARRFSTNPTGRFNDVGFRCVAGAP